jgi:hypothetical protein
MGMKDTSTGKTVQLVFILSFGNLLIQEYSLIGRLFFNVNKLVSQLFQCYFFSLSVQVRFNIM